MFDYNNDNLIMNKNKENMDYESCFEFRCFQKY